MNKHIRFHYVLIHKYKILHGYIYTGDRFLSCNKFENNIKNIFNTKLQLAMNRLNDYYNFAINEQKSARYYLIANEVIKISLHSQVKQERNNNITSNLSKIQKHKIIKLYKTISKNNNTVRQISN